MKNQMTKLSLATVSVIIITVSLITFGMSCKKSSDNANFTGTYTGTLVTGLFSEGDTVIISAGSTSSSVVMQSKTARGSTYTIEGTVTGSSLNIPSQQVYVSSLAATYTTTGSGSINNSALVINYTFTSTGGTSTNFVFNGTKN